MKLLEDKFLLTVGKRLDANTDNFQIWVHRHGKFNSLVAGCGHPHSEPSVSDEPADCKFKDIPLQSFKSVWSFWRDITLSTVIESDYFRLGVSVTKLGTY